MMIPFPYIMSRHWSIYSKNDSSKDHADFEANFKFRVSGTKVSQKTNLEIKEFLLVHQNGAKNVQTTWDE